MEGGKAYKSTWFQGHRCGQQGLVSPGLLFVKTHRYRLVSPTWSVGGQGLHLSTTVLHFWALSLEVVSSLPQGLCKGWVGPGTGAENRKGLLKVRCCYHESETAWLNTARTEPRGRPRRCDSKHQKCTIPLGSISYYLHAPILFYAYIRKSSFYVQPRFMHPIVHFVFEI